MSVVFLESGVWAPTWCVDAGLGTIAATLPFTPRQWERPIPVRRGRFTRMVETDEQRTAKGNVLAFLEDGYTPARRLEGPVALTCDFVLEQPAKWNKQHRERNRFMPTSSPDLDNLAKLVKDALTVSARFYRDDAQVVTMALRKRYGPVPVTLITVGPA